MSDFPTHDVESAPEKSKPLLESSLKGFGMIPGLHAVMAEAPGVLEAYQKLHQLVLDSSFDNDEKRSSGRPSTLKMPVIIAYLPTRVSPG